MACNGDAPKTCIALATRVLHGYLRRKDDTKWGIPLQLEAVNVRVCAPGHLPDS